MTETPQTTPLLEREKIITTAVHHARRHRVVILHGLAGCGKSALLDHVTTKLDETKGTIPAIYIEHCTPYKSFLLDIIYQMFRRSLLPESDQTQEWDDLYKFYNRGHSRLALTLIYTVVEAYPDLTFCVDNIDTATSHGISLFRHLLQSNNPPRLVCTAKSIQRLNYLVWQAEILPLEPLSKSAVTKMVDQYIQTHGLRVASIKTFYQQVYTISAGNPLAVMNNLRYCRYEPVIKKHLLSSRSLSAGRKELDMSFIVVIIFVLAMMSRYIARSIGDTHLYMLGSIIAALTIGGRYFVFKGAGKETS